MIIDNKKNKELYYGVHPRFRAAFEFIEKVERENLAPGRYELDGDNLFVNVSEYELGENKGIYEAHGRYIDIQYIIEGKEAFNCAMECECEVTQAFDEKIDAALYSCNGLRTHIEAGEGDFAIFFPQDVHNPGVKLGEGVKVKKAIAKVLI
ncbi:MAG: YhcH/YjgK/YiaL family protein [Oscillospiraceae bacterium]|nr:YhcH/YjgK/YiaL family protein [Oscillospiraceae bacterium]